MNEYVIWSDIKVIKHQSRQETLKTNKSNDDKKKQFVAKS